MTKKAFLLLLCLLAINTIKAQLIINEVLYDPSNTALQGDANGDGIYDQVQDEFIELVNTSAADLDVSRYRIYDLDTATGLKTLRHTMGSDVILPPGGALVVFGGGTAVGSFGGAHVEVDVGTAGLSLGNSGEKILISDSSGNWVDSINTNALSNNPNESYTRNPDITGDFFQHGSVVTGVLFSPGTRTDGSPFNTQTRNQNFIRAENGFLFPNPGSGNFFLSKNLRGKAINILDSQGRIILQLPSGCREFSLSGYPNGIYHLKPESGKSQSFLLSGK